MPGNATSPTDSDGSDGGRESAPPAGRPALLVGAIGLILLEAVALAVLSVLIVVDLLSGIGGDAVTSVSLGAALLGLAALLVVGARALAQGRRWGRGPVVTWQLLQFFIGLSALGSDSWWGTVLPAVVAVAVLIGVLAPASRAATAGRAQPDAVL